MAHILIIDDNPTNRETFADILSDAGHTCITARTGEEGLAQMTGAAVDVVLCDYKLPNLDGLSTMELAHERHHKMPWVLITGHGNEEIAVSSIKRGAFNYLTKPVDLSRLKATIESAAHLAHAHQENIALRRELGYDEALDRIIGSSQAAKHMKQLIKQVAPSDATVLIDGESGTGKELVADALHALSQRSMRPYVKLNTAAIPHELLESELFGHERGAFTGAVQQKKGRFELADTGTLFLDEIGEMQLDSQVKLLRVLQDGSFSRVGGIQNLSTDVRLICATNRHLKTEVLENRFRMDLFYRLNVINISVPSLRERREDIPMLSQFFVDQLNKKHHHNKCTTDELMQTVRRMDWPGNIRELENTIERCYVMSTSQELDHRLLLNNHWSLGQQQNSAPALQTTSVAVAYPQTQPAAQTTTPPAPAHLAPPAQPPTTEDAIESFVGLPLDEVEKRLILATLKHCNGNKSKSARLLHIGLKTLYRKLENYSKSDGLDNEPQT